jgi:hypothetical protein
VGIDNGFLCRALAKLDGTNKVSSDWNPVECGCCALHCDPRYDLALERIQHEKSQAHVIVVIECSNCLHNKLWLWISHAIQVSFVFLNN